MIAIIIPAKVLKKKQKRGFGSIIDLVNENNAKITKPKNNNNSNDE
jgi:hypothetical protein